MSQDLFDELIASEVPPPPVELDRRLHERLNRSLAFGHLVELFVHAVPYAVLHLAAAVTGLAAYTTSGEYPVRKQPGGIDPPARGFNQGERDV
jgi:hypothetical protein